MLVSIICNFYNHEKFVSQTINSFLSQKKNFEFEILLHDDCSNDSTPNILREFENYYPNLIKVIYQKENQYLKGINVWTEIQFPRAKGKYIALCDGDDYWTDPYKLQKQVDYLENNPDCAFTCHSVHILNESGNAIPWKVFEKAKEIILTEDIIKAHFIPTLSLVFRTSIVNKIPSWFNKIQSGDIALELILSTYGYGFYFFNNMGVYRFSGSGITITYSLEFYKFIQNKIYLYCKFNEFSNNKFKEILNNRIIAIISYYVKNNSSDSKLKILINSLYLLKDLLDKKYLIKALKLIMKNL
ncbi:MAG TPA: glycosyltransferase [Ignavibacteria bacterium]|nr:glycosyltransferase [Ignavibacteria bacterium]